MKNMLVDEALERLLAGNLRFVAGRRVYPNQSIAHCHELVEGQKPFAAILGCSDSRVPPEIIFDQGLGNLFTVRVAGNIVDNAILGSLEYAVQHLGVPLIVVLGHSGCGTVQAAMSSHDAQGHIPTLVAAILPAVKLARSVPGEPLDQAVRIHISMVVHQLRAADPILCPLVEERRISIIGCHYDLVSGVVELLV